MERKHWIVKNSNDTFKTVRDGFAAVGWSDLNFSEKYYTEGPSAALNAAILQYHYDNGRYAGRKRGEISRFLSIKGGDIVIVPCEKGFYMGESTGEFGYNTDYISIDRANVLKVNFKKGKDGNPLFFARDGKLTKLSTKIGSRHMLLEVWEDDIKKYIDELYDLKTDVSITSEIHNIENEKKEELRVSIRENLKNYNNVWLEAKGIGFEKLISNLFEVAGYETHILSKRTGDGYADADIVAMRFSRLGNDFNEVLFIQVKHHEGKTGTWGKEQLELFRKQIEEDRTGTCFRKTSDGNDIEIDTSRIKYVLITSAEFSNDFMQNEDANDIILIDGADLSNMIVEYIDELDTEIRYKLGYFKQYKSYKDYKSMK